MKCLTVMQPWAWAIIHGPKRIENRTWKTEYRGPLVIHAGRSHKWLDAMPETYWAKLLPGMESRQLVYGAALGVIDLVGCVKVASVEGQLFAEGPWCWLLESPRPLPVPAYFPGQQHLFNVPDGVITESAF